jgi:hypothetical protein
MRTQRYRIDLTTPSMVGVGIDSSIFVLPFFQGQLVLPITFPARLEGKGVDHHVSWRCRCCFRIGAPISFSP